MSGSVSPNLIGCHASVWTGHFDTDGLEKAFRGTAEAGFDLIELPIFAPREWDVVRTQELAAEYGLAVSASLGLTEELNLSSEDNEIVRRGEDHLTAVLEVLHDLGSSHLCGVIYGPMRKHMRPATALEVRNGQSALSRLAATAARLGIRMGLEVVNRYETNILNTAAQAKEYVHQVNAENLGVHLDTYHMNIEEPDMFTPVVAAADRLEYVHCGESHRGYLGTGSVDFGSFYRALRHVAFDGPIVFESFSSAVVDPQLTGTLGIWRNLWRDSGDLARHANTSIRTALRSIDTIALH